MSTPGVDRASQTAASEPPAAPGPADTRLPPGDPDLYRAIRVGAVDDVRQLVAEGKEVNVSDENGDPLLYAAIWRDKENVVELLIDSGADVNAKDSEGNPLLREAI